jgi:hypothetical protein
MTRRPYCTPRSAITCSPKCRTADDGGYGFHSNDARGIVSQVTPATPMPRSVGGEVGVRTALVPGLQSSVSLWVLDLNSELVWDADVGTTGPSGPTRRYGVESGNYYTPMR